MKRIHVEFLPLSTWRHWRLWLTRWPVCWRLHLGPIEVTW